MKRIKIILLSVLLISFNSCIFIDTDSGFDNDNSVIELSILGPKTNNKVSPGEKIDIKIDVEDNDGINKVNLTIPDLGVDKTFHSNSDDVEINESFIIADTMKLGKVDVLVKVTDDDGDVTEIEDKFEVQ